MSCGRALASQAPADLLLPSGPYCRDMLALLKRILMAVDLRDPTGKIIDSATAHSLLDEEAKRTSLSLLRLVASAAAKPQDIIDRLTKHVQTAPKQAEDAKFATMERMMKEMQGQMSAMAKKQEELVVENKQLRTDAMAWRDEARKGLSGAVRAEVNGDLATKVGAAVQGEAVKVVNSMFHQKVLELTKGIELRMGNVFEEGRGAGHADMALPPHGYGQPHPPPPPPPQQQHQQQQQHGRSSHASGASPSGHSNDTVTSAQLHDAIREVRNKQVHEKKVADDSYNSKLVAYDEKLKPRWAKIEKEQAEQAELARKVRGMKTNLRRLEEKAGIVSSGLTSGAASPAPSVESADLGASRKRARTEGSGAEGGGDGVDHEAAATRAAAQTAELDKVKKELEGVNIQIEAIIKAQADAPPPTPAAPAPSTANFVTKFSFEESIGELTGRVEDLEKASIKTNSAVREQRIKVRLGPGLLHCSRAQS